MKTNGQMEASRIADAIVGLVERTDGPVTLARIGREFQASQRRSLPPGSTSSSMMMVERQSYGTE
jgi:hypothetical protein